MLAKRPTQPKNRWQAKGLTIPCALLASLFLSHASFAADGRSDYDLDNDGLIEINDLADLNEIRNNRDGKTLYGSNAGCPRAADGTYRGGCIGFELTTDLNFDSNQDGLMDANDLYWNSGSGWEPIGSIYSSSGFTATLDGNGYVIKNLFINSSSDYKGLFGVIEDAHIRNLGLTGPLMKVSGDEHVGALVGWAKNSNIKSVFNTGNVQGRNRYIGGLVGRLYLSTLENGFNSGSVKGRNEYIGGIVGYQSDSVLKNVHNIAPVTGDHRTGGITGYLYSSSTTPGQIINGLNDGLVTDFPRTSGYMTVGGVIGSRGGSAHVIRNSYWATDASGQTGGYLKSVENSYVGLPLATLQCAIQANTDANNSSCVSSDGVAEGLDGAVTLFKEWDQALLDGQSLWDFGNNTQTPALTFNGRVFRDSDGDGSVDFEDAFPLNTAANEDWDLDGYPDAWSDGCDVNCMANSGLQLDQFPQNAEAYLDSDEDGYPDVWASNCDEQCQQDSILELDQLPNNIAAHLDSDFDGLPDEWNSNCYAVCRSESPVPIDAHPLDRDNDGISDLEDTDDNNDGVTDIDADSDGLIDISTLEQLQAMQFQLSGEGLQLTTEAQLDKSGCPVTTYDGYAQHRCVGYELTGDLDFDTNGDGLINDADDYWNAGEGWLPIGTESSPFTGKFNGNGYVIRHLMVNRPSTDYIGLFGYINKADIRQVMLSDVHVQGSKYVAGLVGYALDDNTLEANGVMGSVKSTGGDSYIGGILGFMRSDNTARANFVSGSIIGRKYVGGLIGIVDNSNNNDASVIEGNLSIALVQGSYYTGGLLGSLERVADVQNNYWATDASGQTYSSRKSEADSYVGLPLVVLRCAVQANTDSTSGYCVSPDGVAEGLSGPVTLYRDWDTFGAIDSHGVFQAYWAFGSEGHLPALNINGVMTRDNDLDGVADQYDAFPGNVAASNDIDGDGYPDVWNRNCDLQCRTESGLVLDQFPLNADAWQDEDQDGLPDSWAASCDATCQSESDLTLDAHPNDTDNDGITNQTDTDDNNDGLIDADINNNGLIDIATLDRLHAMRYQLDGTGLRMTDVDALDQSGCPGVIDQGVLVNRCHGYELTNSLDFDTNQDGAMNADDAYWNSGLGWDPIGSNDETNRFSATFEGNGHVIRNLFINRSSYYQGLFGVTQNAVIRNVGLTGPLMSVSGGRDYVGSLIGRAYSSEIKNVFNTGAIQGTGDQVGGLVGYLQSSSLENALNTGPVTGEYYVGGIVGEMYSNSRITNALSTGLVSGQRAGGLVGRAYSRIENSYWASDASGQTTSAGESADDSYVGLPLASLQCAITANSSCVSGVTLFNDWDQALFNGQPLWDFGSDSLLPAMSFHGDSYRDSDGDSVADFLDDWPFNPVASQDTDADGYPDAWNRNCDLQCRTESGLVLDQFPLNADAWQDEDQDGLPDSWAASCDATCQGESDLTLDAHPNDTDNDGITNQTDTDDNNDGLIDADINNNGLIDITTLDRLHAMRYQLDGTGLRMTDVDALDQSGCPDVLDQGVLVNRCHGYELTNSLDFDTNQDGAMNADDAYWNSGLGWDPIGSNDETNRFSATFEGNGHVIRNLFINRSSDYQGLFGVTQNAVIRNVGLTGPLMSVSGRSYVGSLIGRAYSSEIKNVLNTGAIQGVRYSTGASYNTGGLVGRLDHSSLENALNIGPVTGEYDVGGLAGYVYSHRYTQFSRITNGLSTDLVSGRNTGGLVGDKNYYDSVIENSYWASDASGQTTSAGESADASYVGLPLASLQCATTANSSCGSGVTLFNDWDQALFNGQPLWDFGSATQPPGLVFNGVIYRDSDFDGVHDLEDKWPTNPSASQDADADGHPDAWNRGCDAICIVNSGLQLDQFPQNADAWQDEDLDGLPDSWAASCDATCQSESDLTLDAHPNDTDNDGIANQADTDDNNDGLTDVDANSNGLIEIDNLAKLNAMRYQLDGTGLRMTDVDVLDQSGCPSVIDQGVLVSRCHGYELTNNLDFDTNQDGAMNTSDAYWNSGLGWNPIGSNDETNRFSATFEGNGHVIRNLFINRSSDYLGLFGVTQNTVIRNVGLTGPLMGVSGRSHVGSLIGRAHSSEVKNVFNTGVIQGTDDVIGGLVGRLSNSSLENALNTGTVAGNRYIGGLTGSVDSSAANQYSLIKNGLSTGLVSGIDKTGGLVGATNGYINFISIENSYWAVDSSGLISSAAESEGASYVGLPLVTLQCAPTANTDSNNSSCVSSDGIAEGLTGPVTVFNGWNQALWDFGNTSQLPALNLKGNVYRDTDGDSIIDQNDAYPLIAIGELLDTDNDGAPDTCDTSCIELGMAADSDDDNDGVLDDSDAYPLIAIGGLLDSDNDGVPNTCDTSCVELGMSADLDDDNDGLLDVNDAYPLVAIGELLDSDNDGAPNVCDVNCLELGMTADLDDDNDGLLDVNDAYPLIAIGELLDTDNDGAPDTCDTSCVELGMSADLDDDNDGVLDGNDTYPLIAIGDLLDSDNDGAPNTCDTSCVELGMSADLDDDNDGVLDINDVYPLIAIGELLDTDNDGAPNVCDVNCLELGMTADLDDDNDGLLDVNDAYPLIAIGELLDTDNDGAPDTCDTSCIELGMAADTDDDNDGVLDDNDAYPLIAIGGLLDTDNDGAPDACDTSCVELGMSADLDDDNDGVADINDVYPLIAIGELLDTDNDGAPNACDLDCLALGMVDDLDDDNDGVLDSSDAYPLISLDDRLDSDRDGIPNQCDASCLELGMAADSDDDNDGLLDVNDAYPLVAIGELLDTDNDGAPDTCDTSCVELGMSADLDDDNDGVLDANDVYPLVAIDELLDTDNDGAPDTCDTSCVELGMSADLDDDNDGVADINDSFPLDNTEHSDFDGDGIGDVADLDDDNDGVDDVNDPNLGADNGAPEIRYVPSIEPVAVTTENGDAFELLVDDNFLNAFTTYDAVDTEFTYEASLNGNVLAIDENDIMLIPAGRQAVQVVAIDAAGNRSEPVEMVAIVYPQVRFEQATSIVGENSTTNIKVSLTGDAPDYPVVINFAINELSDVNQADLDAGFDITAQHQVIIEASDTEVANRDGFIEIGIIDDNESENDELLIVDLLSAKLESEADNEIESLFEIDETNMQHELTVTYENLAPVVNLKLEQNGIEVAKVQQDAGMVSITAIVQDGNGNDVHTLTWDLNNLGLHAPLGNTLNFSPASLPVSTYEISVIATDNGIGQLSDDAVIRFDVVAPPVVVPPVVVPPVVLPPEVEKPVDGDPKEAEEPKSSGGSGGGATPLWLMLLLLALVSGVGVRRENSFT